MGRSGKGFHKYREVRHVHQTSGACGWLEQDVGSINLGQWDMTV